MKTIRKSFCLLFLIFPTQSIAFEDQGGIEGNTQQQDEQQLLQGAVFDRTITQTGLSFYQAFTRRWLAESGAVNYTLTVKETPSARHGSIVWIEENNRQLYRVIIGVHSKKIAEKVKDSLKVIKNKLGKKQIIIR